MVGSERKGEGCDGDRMRYLKVGELERGEVMRTCSSIVLSNEMGGKNVNDNVNININRNRNRKSG